MSVFVVLQQGKGMSLVQAGVIGCVCLPHETRAPGNVVHVWKPKVLELLSCRTKRTTPLSSPLSSRLGAPTRTEKTNVPPKQRWGWCTTSRELALARLTEPTAVAKVKVDFFCSDACCGRHSCLHPRVSHACLGSTLLHRKSLNTRCRPLGAMCWPCNDGAAINSSTCTNLFAGTPACLAFVFVSGVASNEPAGSLAAGAAMRRETVDLCSSDEEEDETLAEPCAQVPAAAAAPVAAPTIGQDGIVGADIGGGKGG